MGRPIWKKKLRDSKKKLQDTEKKSENLKELKVLTIDVGYGKWDSPIIEGRPYDAVMIVFHGRGLPRQKEEHDEVSMENKPVFNKLLVKEFARIIYSQVSNSFDTYLKGVEQELMGEYNDAIR